MSHRPPNILLITTDQQRYDALGINGNRVLRTPNLDSLAAGGVNFSRCYSTCPICIPAKRTLISGLHPDTHGVTGYRPGCSFDPAHTMPGCLKKAGYQTQLVGGIDLHPQRKRFGFDHMILSESAIHHPNSSIRSHNDYTNWLIERGHTHHSTSHGINGNGRVARPWGLNEELHHTSWIAEQSARFFDTSRDPTVPWFLHVSFAAPHPPLIPPQAYWDRYIHRGDLLPTIGEWAPKNPARRGRPADAATGPYDPNEIHDAIAGYYGLINHIDDRINYLIQRFFEPGNPRSQEPTYILFSSDHGEMLGDHHLFRKSLPYEASAHIPFFISGRNVDLPRDKTADALVCWEDIMPTVLDLAGVPVPDGLDGHSLLPIIRGVSTSVRSTLNGVHTGYASNRYIVHESMKYLWFMDTHEEQLFDLSADPHETRDLSGNVDLISPMRDRMEEISRRQEVTYDRSLLRPCCNMTPGVFKYAV